MPDSTHDEGRPGERAALNVNNGDSASVPLTADVLRDLDALAAHVAGAFVVVLEVTGGKYRRRCYLTGKSAENAARNATARGENATVYLAELKPVWRVTA